MNCADKYNLIELSDLIGFGYELNDTEDGLKCWIMGMLVESHICNLANIVCNTRSRCGVVDKPLAL